MNALRLIDLDVGYRNRNVSNVVLHDLSVEVARGELVCLLGPNGVGKSTLLRTIAKVQPRLEGDIEIDGASIDDINPLQLARKIGVVLTDRVDVGALPASRIVELGRYPHLNWAGSLRARDYEVVHWAMASVGVEHLGPKDWNTLSDGERQRVLIARALAQEPVVLLLDEPTAFLDVASRVELIGLLRHLARNEDLAVVLSTHDLELALRTADTIWLAAPNGLFLTGSPEDVVFAGHLGKIFESNNVIFHPEDRTFRLLPGLRGSAVVKGEGLAASLAAGVLEREGYQVTRDGSAPLSVTIHEDARWEACFGEDSKQSGGTFAELGDLVRSLTANSKERTHSDH